MGMCVRVGRVVSLGFHRQSFNQWDAIVLLIKSTAYLMHGASGSQLVGREYVQSAFSL